MAAENERGALFRVIVPNQHIRVTYAELLFDLVFVFAVTQLSHMLLGRFTPLGAVQVTLLFLAVWWVWVYATWIVAWFTTYGLFIRIRSMAEHACLEGGRDPLRNTRTTHASLLARLTVAPHEVGFHLEHHLLPTVPYFRLRALHRRLRAHIPESALAPSYLSVLRTVSSR
ncbi:MAG: low temperature requirement protein A [Polyangiales bacterium]